jgi:hypothetical protein
MSSLSFLDAQAIMQDIVSVVNGEGEGTDTARDEILRLVVPLDAELDQWTSWQRLQLVTALVSRVAFHAFHLPIEDSCNSDEVCLCDLRSVLMHNIQQVDYAITHKRGH